MFSFDVLMVVVVMVIVVSIEILLSVEVIDKFDFQCNIILINCELKVQGLGNIFFGLFGGLLVIQVIVCSLVNIVFGVRLKFSVIMYGFFLLIVVVVIGGFFNLILFVLLVVVLIIVGYKLVKLVIFFVMYCVGWEQFLFFMVMIIVMLVIDLLLGVIVGLVVSVFFIFKYSYKNLFYFCDIVENQNDLEIYYIVLVEEVLFFNKFSILKKLNFLFENLKVILDFINLKFVVFDVIELVKDFSVKVYYCNIFVEMVVLKY